MSCPSTGPALSHELGSGCSHGERIFQHPCQQPCLEDRSRVGRACLWSKQLCLHASERTYCVSTRLALRMQLMSWLPSGKHADAAADVLQAAETRKIVAYKAKPTSRLPNGDRIVPFALTQHACMGREATSLLWHLAADAVARQAWKHTSLGKPAETVMTCFFRMAAMIGRAVSEGQARVMLAAGPLPWQ